MKTRVTDECTACNLCIDSVPDVFEMGEDDIARVKVDTIPKELEGDVRQAAEDCPVEAIIVEE